MWGAVRRSMPRVRALRRRGRGGGEHLRPPLLARPPRSQTVSSIPRYLRFPLLIGTSLGLNVLIRSLTADVTGLHFAPASRDPTDRPELVAFLVGSKVVELAIAWAAGYDCKSLLRIFYRERTRSRPPPREREEEKIDINIRREESRPPPPRDIPVEEIRFRRGGGDRPAPPRTTVDKTEIDIRETSAPPPRARTVIDREEIDIRERRSPAPPRSVVDKEEIEIRDTRRGPRGREVFKEEIDIRERSRHRSVSRPNLVARKEEEWIVRRPRTPPPQDYEKEEIIIRRIEKSVSPEPEPPREPTPEPLPPPPPEPIYRPPIIQEVITHHRHIDHGVERARSPTPPPPPPSPPQVKDDSLEIEIKRKGTRNGKAYEEDIWDNLIQLYWEGFI